MVGFIAILKNDLKLFIKDWKALALLIIMPFFFIYIFYYGLSPVINKNNLIKPFNIALVDYEDSMQTKLVAGQLDELNIFESVLRIDENRAMQMLSNNEIAAVIIIPSDFSESLMEGKNDKPIVIIGNKSMPLETYTVKNIAFSAIDLLYSSQNAVNTVYYYSKMAGSTEEELDQKYSNLVVKYFINLLSRNDIFYESKAGSNLNVTPFEYFTAGIVAMFLMLSGMPGAKMLVTEKSLKLTDRLRATPVRMWQILLSKFIIITLFSLIQFAAVLIFGSLFFGNYLEVSFLNFAPAFIVLVFGSSAWAMFVAAISPSSSTADIIGNLSILIMAIIGGNIYPLTAMPDYIKVLSKFTINKWAMDCLIGIFSGYAAVDVYYPILIMLLLEFAIILISCIIIKFGRKLKY